MPNEVAHYPEIQQFIEAQLKSNFRAGSQELFVYWGIGELKTNLQRILAEHPAECACAQTFARRVPLLGFMQWDSLTQNVEYSNLGAIKSLSELSAKLAAEFA